MIIIFDRTKKHVSGGGKEYITLACKVGGKMLAGRTATSGTGITFKNPRPPSVSRIRLVKLEKAYLAAQILSC